MWLRGQVGSRDTLRFLATGVGLVPAALSEDHPPRVNDAWARSMGEESADLDGGDIDGTPDKGRLWRRGGVESHLVRAGGADEESGMSRISPLGPLRRPFAGDKGRWPMHRRARGMDIVKVIRWWCERGECRLGVRQSRRGRQRRPYIPASLRSEPAYGDW